VNAEKTVFVFRGVWISCKSVAMKISDQFEIFASAGIENDVRPRYGVVPMREDCAWGISGIDFETISVTPSIDASAAGHWHGFIANGEVT
jgi:hypothetical protein